MKTVDVWETIAAIAMRVERERAAGNIPQSELGAYSVASTIADMNRAAQSLHRIETERANGFRTERARVEADAKEAVATKRLFAVADKLRITATIEDMGYVTLTAGAFRLGYLPIGVRS